MEERIMRTNEHEYDIKYRKVSTMQAEKRKQSEKEEQDRIDARRKFEEIYVPEKGDLDYFSIEDRIHYHFH